MSSKGMQRIVAPSFDGGELKLILMDFVPLVS